MKFYIVKPSIYDIKVAGVQRCEILLEKPTDILVEWEPKKSRNPKIKWCQNIDSINLKQFAHLISVDTGNYLFKRVVDKFANTFGLSQAMELYITKEEDLYRMEKMYRFTHVLEYDTETKNLKWVKVRKIQRHLYSDWVTSKKVKKFKFEK